MNMRADNKERSGAGQAAVWQARLIMLVMINIAQLWILAATVDAALARHYTVLIPLVVGSGVLQAWRPVGCDHAESRRPWSIFPR